MLNSTNDRPSDDRVFAAPKRASVSNRRSSIPLLSPREVSGITRDWWNCKLAAGVEKAADGEVKLTLFHRVMPADWLWDESLVLPVLAAVGGWQMGTDIPLVEDPSSLSGYSLEAKVPFQDGMLDASFSCVPLEHHRIHPDPSGQLPSGHHVEFMWLLDENGFCGALNAQGKEAFHVFPKVFARLPTSFYNNPDLFVSKVV